jgi:hypothetical protein
MDVDAGEEGGGDGGLRVQEIDAYWLQRRVAAAFPALDASAAQRMAADVFGALQARLRDGGAPRAASPRLAARRACGDAWPSPSRVRYRRQSQQARAHGVTAPSHSLAPLLSSNHAPPTQEDEASVENKVVQLLGLDQFPLAKELLRNRAKIVWVTKLRQAQVGVVARRRARSPAVACRFGAPARGPRPSSCVRELRPWMLRGHPVSCFNSSPRRAPPHARRRPRSPLPMPPFPQDDAERAQIEEAMAGDPEGAAILEALHATRTTARERQTAMERQARGGRAGPRATARRGLCARLSRRA